MTDEITPKLTRATPTAVEIEDCEKVELFFRSVLGFGVRERSRSDEGGMFSVSLEHPAGGAKMTLVCRSPESGARPAPEPVLVMFAVEHLNELVAELREKDVEFEEIPRASGLPIRFARFNGPERLIIELVERAGDRL